MTGTGLPTLRHSDLNLSRRVLLGTALLVPLAPRAHAQGAPVDLVAARRKIAAYHELYRATSNMQASWQRYLGSVSGPDGPTGTESRMLGVLAPPPATAQLAAAEALLAAPPAAGDADRAAKALIQFYREIQPLMTEAAAFYPGYVPKDDQGRAGQVWHRKMKSTAGFTIDARTDLFKGVDAFRDTVELQELAAFEKRGKDGRWLVRRATVEGRKLRNALPLAPGPVDLAGFETRLKAFGAFADEADAWDKANPGKLMMFSGSPRTFLVTMIRLHGQLAGRPASPAASQADLITGLTAFAQLTEMADLYLMNAG